MLRVYGFLAILFALGCLFSSPHGAFATEPEIGRRWQNYVRYQTQKELEATLAQIEPSLKPVHDPQLRKRGAQLVRYVDRVYRLLFPQLMSKKKLADFVIVQSNNFWDTSTYNINPREGATEYHAYLVLPQIIFRSKHPEQDGKIIGVIAHELAHVYLNHTYVDRLVLDAWEDGSGEKLDTQKLINFKLFLSDAYVAGHGFDEVWSGLPAGTSLSRNALIDLMTQLKDQYPSAQCVQAGNEMYVKLLHPILSKSYSYFEWRNAFSDLQRRISGAMIDSFEEQIITCSRSLGFKSTALRDTHFPNAFMTIDSEKYIGFRLHRNFKWDDQNEFEVLFELGKAIQRDMRRTIVESRFESIRWRSFEDEADDFALAIMRELGLPVDGFTNGLLDAMEQVRPGFSLKCRTAIASDETLPYGGLDDPHHAMCYRIKGLESRFNSGMDKSIQP
jgi:hypothetical protein